MNPAPAIDADAVQLALPLEPGSRADTPPPCGFCQGRRCVLAGWGGWLDCTWCDGTGVAPLDGPALRVLRQDDDRDVRRSA